MAYKVFAQDIASPFSHMIFYSLAHLSKKAEKLIGLKAKPALQEIIETRVRWCLEEKNSLALERKILARFAEPKFYRQIIKESYSSLKEFHQAALSIRDQDFTDVSSRQLAETLRNYLKIWLEVTIWGHLVTFSDFHFNLLSDKAVHLIDQRIEKFKSKISSAEAFAVLTTPTKRSQLLEQDLALFRLLAKVQKSKKPEDEFKKLSFQRTVRGHVRQYDWLQYGYLGPTILDEQYFLDILKGFARQKIKASEKIKEIIQRERETAKKQKEFKKKLGLGRKELYWIAMAREFGYLKGLRKEITFIACRSYDSLLKEIAGRLDLSLRQLQFLTPKEIFNGLAGKKIPSVHILNQRIKYCVVFYPKGEVAVYLGQKAKKLAGQIKEEKVEKELKELKGSPAFPGRVKGRVVMIFEAKDIEKMKKGGILVSPATNPNLMPAIVRAGAIVTDEGGITCHAAIVSRELKIPCVIGTKIATRVLRDGQLVEVDATKGVVRVLEK